MTHPDDPFLPPPPSGAPDSPLFATAWREAMAAGDDVSALFAQDSLADLIAGVYALSETQAKAALMRVLLHLLRESKSPDELDAWAAKGRPPSSPPPPPS